MDLGRVIHQAHVLAKSHFPPSPAAGCAAQRGALGPDRARGPLARSPPGRRACFEQPGPRAPPGRRVGAQTACPEIYHDETYYTYSPRFERAARPTRGADAHAERLPWACGTKGGSWGTPGARVARFGACVPHGPRHRAPLREHVRVPHGPHEGLRAVLVVRAGGVGPGAPPARARTPRRARRGAFPGPGRAREAGAGP